jgi:hypothetical protein
MSPNWQHENACQENKMLRLCNAKEEGELGSEVFIEYFLGVLGVLARGN